MLHTYVGHHIDTVHLGSSGLPQWALACNMQVLSVVACRGESCFAGSGQGQVRHFVPTA